MRSPMRPRWSGWLPSVTDMEWRSSVRRQGSRNASQAPVGSRSLAAWTLLLALIHRSAWKGNSANFACTVVLEAPLEATGAVLVQQHHTDAPRGALRLPGERHAFVLQLLVGRTDVVGL